MSRYISIPLTLLCAALLASPATSQDISPLRNYHVWQPMTVTTNLTDAQLDDARQAGYDTVLFKVYPSVSADNKLDFAYTDALIKRATDRGFKVILPILGWVGLGDEYRFWDTDESGAKIQNMLDPFWPEAMRQVEWYYREVINRYKSNPKVVAFAPTWGIYGEAGFTSFTAGRSPHALARFNEWRAKHDLPALDKLPTRQSGPNTEFNRFIRFRFLYMEQLFDSMIRRLKRDAGKTPVGMWQEMYPVIGYLWNQVEVPSADFALYEACLAFQSMHHPEKCLAETMGLRYRCHSAADYRNYFLPLLARKRGEGQRFMGCQITNDYAKNYGWTEDYAAKIGLERFEDEFGPYLKKLLDEPLESPRRDVLLVFPTYAAAALTDYTLHFADAALIDVTLRMYGCQMVRYGSPRLDKMTVEDMNRFKLIIVPDAAFITSETYAKLKQTEARVLLTGQFAQAVDGEYVPYGESREFDGASLEYLERAAGDVSVAAESPLTRGLKRLLAKQPVHLPKDEAFRYRQPGEAAGVLLRCGDDPLLSVRYESRMILVHGHLWAAECYNPKRIPPDMGASADASANEVDMWGPYDSAHPQNVFGCALMKNILDYAGVDYRVAHPKPRGLAPFIGDNMEQASISANIVYNNTARPQTLTVRTPFQPHGRPSVHTANGYETRVTVPPFSYIAL
jgi:hypothetical protein